VFLMDRIGMSASLGAFLAGILLADSEYRHQIEADIAPFEGLLLGLFFVTVGMTLNVNLLRTQPGTVLAAVAGIVVVKAAVLYAVGRWQELGGRAARRFAIVVSQGGEFGFVVLAAAAAGGVIAQDRSDLIVVAITLSMATTPLLLALDDLVAGHQRKPEPRYDKLPKKSGHVVIAGFGRFGQIVARVLRATGIPFTALDISAEQVNFVNQYGNKIYYGDASRLGILEAAQTKDARAFVLAIDDVNTSLRTAEIVRTHFPHVPIYARARNRQHVHSLMDLGVENIERETFLSALAMTKDVLHDLGTPRPRAEWIVKTFKEKDERRLYDDYKDRSDTEKMRLRALKQSEELAEIFAEDIAGDISEEPAPPKPAKVRQRR
jgi:voltage-gated potassium channel Kch